MNHPTRHPVGPAHHRHPVPTRHVIRRKVLLLLGYYNMPMHLGIARYAHEAGWALCDEYVRIGRPPLWWRGDGIISLITAPRDLRALENFPHLPLVDLSKGWIADTMPEEDRASGIGRPRVIYHNETIGRLGADHFLQRGFKHIAYLNAGNYWLDQERIPAFRQAIEQAGCVFQEIESYRHLFTDSTAAHQWLVQAITDLPKPVGIMITSDDQAPRLMQACDDAGLSVPEEVAVLGCDNDPMVCDYAPVPLSSVDNDWDSVGYEAARLLDQIMNGGAAPTEPVLIPPKGVVTRQSTDILAVPDPVIARALRFIWKHFAEPIGTPEVAAAVGLNRRKLERDFRQYLHRTVNGEITRVRIDFAKKLLKETNEGTETIALKSGFSSAANFSNTFNRITGTRPGAFRRGNAAGGGEA